MTDAIKTVASVSKSQAAMIADAELPRTLMGGTKAMRKAGQKYLPKEPAETQAAYDNRKHRSTLFNAFGKTVADMTGKVFVKPVTLGDDVPAQIEELTEDIDLTGRHLNVFARDVFYDGLQTGGGYILTDMPPKVVRADGQPATLADEHAAKIRPYLVYIPLERLIGWKSTMIGGAETLTQIRVKECVTEPDGEFDEKEVDQIRVINAGVGGEMATWQTWRKSEDQDKQDDWVPHLNGTYSVSKITLAPFYTHRTGFMTFCPPLEKLADINVAHWQSQSDQRNILHVARVPILFGAGFQTDDKLNIGAAEMVQSSDPNAKLTYVEHSGAAIGAGDKDLQNLELQMQAMGLQLLVDGPGGQSATGEIRDDAKENSPLAMMARSLADALEQSLGFMGEYLTLDEDMGGEVEVNTDFGINGSTADLQWLTQACIAGKISDELYRSELQRRGVIGEAYDEKIEADRIASQAPALDGPNLLGPPGTLKPKPKPGAAA